MAAEFDTEERAKEEEEAKQRKEEEIRKAEEEKQAQELEEAIAQEAAELEAKKRGNKAAYWNDPLREIKRKIRCFDTYKKDISIIASGLSKIIPADLSSQTLINIIFVSCPVYKITLLLDALQLIDGTSYSLSPYDKIRKKIVEDQQFSLTNSRLIEMLKKCGADDDEEKLAGCYDLAYRMNHPNIYRLPSSIISTEAYILNFLWVNLNPQDRVNDLSQNIFKDGLDLFENAESIKDPNKLLSFEAAEELLDGEKKRAWQQIKKTFTYKISKWADVLPGGQINLWYDSALVTQKAQQKTFEMMKAISASRGS